MKHEPFEVTEIVLKENFSDKQSPGEEFNDRFFDGGKITVILESKDDVTSKTFES